MMTHAPTDFAVHMLGLLKNCGTTGNSGHTPRKSFNAQENAGTGPAVGVGPIEFDRSRLSAMIGTNIIAKKQILIEPVTTVTSGTAIFKERPHQLGLDGVPTEWHAIVRKLSAVEPVEGFSFERWRELINDGETFLGKWGAAAFKIGWTARDLFGVHPKAPAARYDVMGLIPMLSRAAVMSLTDSAAIMRSQSGAVLTYRRQHQAGAVLLSQMVLWAEIGSTLDTGAAIAR
jgi:hypothetical protein